MLELVTHTNSKNALAFISQAISLCSQMIHNKKKPQNQSVADFIQTTYLTHTNQIIC